VRSMHQRAIEPTQIDQELSNRPIDLDAAGYFIIYLEPVQGLICAKHFTNIIDGRGLACDPETGKPIACNGKVERSPNRIFTGRTAKEICVQIFEQTTPCPVTHLEHAAYLGREFQRAEAALLSGQEYVQD